MSQREEKTFEKLSTNIELLRCIFEKLEHEEQLKFATVSRHLHYFFRRFINKEKYRKISVHKNQQFVSVKNEISQSELQLSYAGLEYFLQVYSEDIEELTEKHGFAINTRPLQNLRSIGYNHMIVTNDHLQMLARYCPKLEKLLIYGCCNRHHDIIRLGEDLRIQTLMEMRMLKHFTLKNATEFKVKSNVFHDMLTQLKLRYHNLRSIIIPEQAGQSPLDSCVASSNSLRELDIYGPFQSSYWSWNLKTYLNYFENLISLTIIICDLANDEVIRSLASACKKLRKLSFKFTTFENIRNFAILANLTDLSFHWCKGLSYENLKEILSEMALEKFSSTYTKYDGLFQYYFISPTLKSIHIDAFHSVEFRSA